MYKSFKTLFFLKKGNGYKGGPMPVYLRVTLHGKRSELSTQRSCDPSKWNQASGRAKGSKPEAIQLNAYLDSIQGKIYEIQKECELKNIRITAEEVKQRLLGLAQEKKHTLLEVFAYHNQQFEALVGKEYSLGTYKKFKCVLTSLTKFLNYKYSLKDISIEAINHQFITEYEFYLKSVQNVQHNTAMSNIKKLKKIVRQCVANQWLEKDFWVSFISASLGFVFPEG